MTASGQQPPPALEIDVETLTSELHALAAISDAAAPAVTRIVFSDTDLRARAWLKDRCHAAGLAVREDAVGNTFARWVGSEPELPPVATGSHIDAIPNAGAYDGTVGVLGGLEAIRALRRSGFRPRRSIELITFTAEEPTRFGIGCLGSRMIAGTLDTSAGQRLRDGGGATLDEHRQRAGFNGPLAGVRMAPDAYTAFLELHIEQGPLLERAGHDIGVVQAIAAPATLRVVIDGIGGHAGAVLMADRHDAFLAAAEIALATEVAAKETGAIDTVATVGVCELFPGAVNSIPSRARLDIDVRDIDEARRNTVLARIIAACHASSTRRGVSVDVEQLNADAPAHCAQAIVDAVVAACERRGQTYARMISRAYHDSLFMSRIAPTGMIFIPCRDGVSHRPDEYASPDAIANGVDVLAHALARLSG
jgi:N-carbamoyl-L-amino-acid hydrolase